MTITGLFSVFCLFFLTSLSPVFAQEAQEESLDNITMEVVVEAREERRVRGIGLPYRENVLQRMLENGAIQQEELNEMETNLSNLRRQWLQPKLLVLLMPKLDSQKTDLVYSSIT